MKNKASGFFKQIIYVLSSVVKAKSIAIKSKTRAIKIRLLLLSLLRNKKVLVGSISHKIRALLGHYQDKRDEEDQSSSKAIVLYNATANDSNNTHVVELDDDDDDDKYPDLTHSLFDEEDDLDFGGASTGSVIDLVRNSKEDGEQFILEDEIDQVADLFIRQFHRQMRFQKQESFKRFQEMLARGL